MVKLLSWVSLLLTPEHLEPGLYHTPPGRSMEGSCLRSSAYPGFARGEEGGHQGRAFKAEDAAEVEAETRMDFDPWLVHVNVWQKPLQYCKVISSN